MATDVHRLIMQEEDRKFDVAIIGAGPAGMMAAMQSARSGLRVVLIEKNSKPGKKLLLTGGGRCNLTNAEFNLKNLVSNYNNGEFLFYAFSEFGPKQTMEFFNNLEIKTKTEAGNRVFPASDSANEILQALKKELVKNKVKILYNSEVKDIKIKENKITKIILQNGEILANKYILATGGKSYPQTGSDGFGFKLAEKLGHKIIKPMPAVSPIRINNNWVKNLQGISLKNIKLNVFASDSPSRKASAGEDGEIIFTHFGISGPAALNISGKVGELLEKGAVKISLDLFPEMNQEEVLKNFEEMLQKYLKQSIKNILCEIAPERFVEVLLEIVKIDKNKIANNMSKIEKNLIVKILKNFEMTAEDLMGFNGAMLTRGGIFLKEINHKTMQSKIIDNLFFAGEIINADGKTGGFNLQMCWSTGFIAGQL